MAFFQRRVRSLVSLALLLLLCSTAASLSADPPNSGSISRDLLWKAPFGAVLTYGYGRLVYNALSVQDIRYPEAHERRVKETIQRAFQVANHQPKRILEVGMGEDCRLLRRGLYDEALRQAPFEIVGIDLKMPSAAAVAAANAHVSQIAPGSTLTVTTGDVQALDNFPDGSFDCIVSCLTLCSVQSPTRAVQELHRVLKPGGTLAYIEHVAVNDNEPYRFLEWQQQLLDPLQQRLADNCHLHRYTEATIVEVFGKQPVHEERFMVDAMWPVTCQACGVMQR